MSAACVLVVDDEPLNVDILTEVLGEAGYETVTASDGVQGWQALQSAPERFDGVLLDRMMPNMNGMELLARIKSSPPHAMLPVILQTARTAREDIIDGLSAGAWYYLCKPFDDQTLLAVVKTATEDYQRYRKVMRQAASSARTLKLMDRGSLRSTPWTRGAIWRACYPTPCSMASGWRSASSSCSSTRWSTVISVSVTSRSPY